MARLLSVADMCMEAEPGAHRNMAPFKKDNGGIASYTHELY